jgi:hypothetical protein
VSSQAMCLHVYRMLNKDSGASWAFQVVEFRNRGKVLGSIRSYFVKWICATFVISAVLFRRDSFWTHIQMQFCSNGSQEFSLDISHSIATAHCLRVRMKFSKTHGHKQKFCWFLEALT